MAALLLFLVTVAASAVLILTPQSDPPWAFWTLVICSVLSASVGVPPFLRELIREPEGVLYRNQRNLDEWSALAVLGTAMTAAHLIAGRRPEVLAPALAWCVVAGYGPLIAWTIQRRKLPNKGLDISRWTDK